jgi:ABC-type sugar transport system substrate-binding protein
VKRMQRRLAVAMAVTAGTVGLAACGGGGSSTGGSGGGGTKTPTVGVIQITLAHGYQQILHDGYKSEAKKDGANMRLCINNLDPSQTIKCGEDLIAAGVDALIVAPADKASFAAVARLAKARKVPVINDGSPQPIQENVVPFTGTDSLGGGRLAGQFAAKWIKDNLGGNAQVGELTLPTFTDCVNRNKGFRAGLGSDPGAKIVASANGSGLRAKALPATENMLQGQPGIQAIFGCNDDSALGALSALQGKGKPAAKTLVVGFDGTTEAFREIKKKGMFRADIVQRPDCYSRRMMDIAVKIARGQAKVADYVKKGYYFVKTPVVTQANVDEWLKWKGTPETAPEKCVFATNHQ